MARTATRRTRSLWVYVVLVGVLVGLTFVFVEGADALARADISRNVFYLILLAAGLAVAAFLDQVLRATDAEWVGKLWFGKFRLGGSVAVVGLVVAGGMYLTSKASPLQLVVRALPPRADPEALGQGTVQIYSGTLHWEKRLSSAGDTVFESLPEQARTADGRVEVAVPGYEVARIALTGIPASHLIEVTLTPEGNTVSGTVITAGGKPLRDAVLDFEHGLVQSRTDALGHFRVEVPRKKGETVLLVVVHDGRVGHQGYYTVPNELTLQFEER